MKKKIKNPLVKVRNNKVLIFPSLQFTTIKQNDDKEILESLLTNVNFTKLIFSTGYLNLPNFLSKIFTKAPYNIDILTSSPRANSFYQGGFIKKYIPYFYRFYERLLLNLMIKNKKENFSLYEFERERWTFHSKGLWLYEKDKEIPSLTIIGSSNLSNNINIIIN